MIPKADGRERPIGVPALEDKIVQRAVVAVLTPIYEEDFVNFSYGFRPKRSAHHALDALSLGIRRRKVSWILDADLRSFFDTLSHAWLVKFLEYRVGDKRVVRLIQKWLRAGVLEEGKRICSEVGTVQGGSISPLLANIYLHYVFDLWTQRWRQKEVRGDMVVVRYADDSVVGFQHRNQAERYLKALIARLEQFGLTLHGGKTRLIEFGRYAVANRRDRGEGKPETFNFLGFTHTCGKTKTGWFTVVRRTMRQRMQSALKRVKAALWQRMHAPVPDQGQFVAAVVRGHAQYYGIPDNSRRIAIFRKAVIRLWYRVLCRRSQYHGMTWKRLLRYATRWIPNVRICHPYPEQRFGVYHPRQEPSALVAHAGICAGGGPTP
jgi:group II intron reverse transcriptase/maturase